MNNVGQDIVYSYNNLRDNTMWFKATQWKQASCFPTIQYNKKYNLKYFFICYCINMWFVLYVQITKLNTISVERGNSNRSSTKQPHMRLYDNRSNWDETLNISTWECSLKKIYYAFSLSLFNLGPLLRWGLERFAWKRFA